MKTVGVITVAIIAGIFSSMWSGYVASIIWGWFAVPLFGLPALSVPAAIGIRVMIGCFTPSTEEPKDDSDLSDRISKAVGKAIFGPAIALLIAFVAKAYL